MSVTVSVTVRVRVRGGSLLDLLGEGRAEHERLPRLTRRHALVLDHAPDLLRVRARVWARVRARVRLRFRVRVGVRVRVRVRV